VHPKKAKEALAMEIIERFWSREDALRAKEEFERVFTQRGLPDEIPEVRYQFDSEEVWLPRILKDTGICKSTGEATRLIKQGGIRIDDKKVSDTQFKLSAGEYIIRIGKRRFYRLIPS
jgi:tyrosyl-tRNA synthetase